MASKSQLLTIESTDKRAKDLLETLKNQPTKIAQSQCEFFWASSIETFQRNLLIEKRIGPPGTAYQKFLKETASIKRNLEYLLYSTGIFLHLYYHNKGDFVKVEQEVGDILGMMRKWGRAISAEYLIRLIRDWEWTDKETLRGLSGRRIEFQLCPKCGKTVSKINMVRHSKTCIGEDWLVRVLR
jgi:hypothetical protein